MLGKLFDNITFNSMSSKAFSKALYSAHKSEAYLEFSKRVHGTDFRQFNLLDKEQYEILIKRLELNPADKVLDLGCGLSELSVHLSDKFGCEVTGLDFAKDYLSTLETPSKVKLIPADLNRIPTFENKFSKAVCLDSFYLLKNPSRVLDSIANSLEKGGKFFLFYTQKTSSGILPKWLEHSSFDIEIMRFDKWNTDFWKRWNSVLEETQEQFINEGNINLWKTKKREWDFQGPLLENNGLIRYLFVLTKSN
jgi:ubiquinone/menaquinone biosynthesis C-methylase UbiE